MKILAGKIKATLIAENEHCIVLRDLHSVGRVRTKGGGVAGEAGACAGARLAPRSPHPPIHATATAATAAALLLVPPQVSDNHLLVIPRKKIESWKQCSPEDLDLLQAMKDTAMEVRLASSRLLEPGGGAEPPGLLPAAVRTGCC